MASELLSSQWKILQTLNSFYPNIISANHETKKLVELLSYEICLAFNNVKNKRDLAKLDLITLENNKNVLYPKLDYGNVVGDEDINKYKNHKKMLLDTYEQYSTQFNNLKVKKNLINESKKFYENRYAIYWYIWDCCASYSSYLGYDHIYELKNDKYHFNTYEFDINKLEKIFRKYDDALEIIYHTPYLVKFCSKRKYSKEELESIYNEYTKC